MLTLYHSTTSPFARKVTASARVLGLANRLELIASTPHPVDRDAAILPANPLGKVPTLVTEDGSALYDSRVIVEYLASLVPGQTLLPAGGAARFTVLRQQALGDGLLDAALLIRYEALIRPDAARSAGWVDGQQQKIASALDAIEAEAGSLGGALTIGTITYAAALGFLDFRFPTLDWRNGHAATAEWFAIADALPALAETRPFAVSAAPAPALASAR
ncbi:Glutathione S-transferase [Kaistia soli DSM 19436]|uniref:Glutathione S-transferase n=1 Tax=Kaistia soli DSM 19436 TaxID=1122133 RepID=A0A1M4WIX7_9HYPH|nr:Glutathione S-transferase [Kaistia soli DSM 19436]